MAPCKKNTQKRQTKRLTRQSLALGLTTQNKRENTPQTHNT